MYDAPAAITVRGFSTLAHVIVGDALTLVDPGTPRVMKLAEKTIVQLLHRDVSEIAAVTATHWHVDHVGGISRAIELTGADILLSRHIAYHLDSGRRIIYPAFHRFINMLRNRPDVKVTPPRLIDLIQMELIALPLQKGNTFPWPIKKYFAEGESLPGHPDWTVIETPGHTPDSVCFWHGKTGTLICGDTILGGNLGAARNRFIWDDLIYEASIAKLKKLKVKRLLPGHGCVLEGKDLLARL